SCLSTLAPPPPFPYTPLFRSADGQGDWHAGALHHPHRHGRRAGLEGREVSAPGAEPAGENRVPQPDTRIYVTGADPESQPTTEPVHRGQDEADSHPSPVQSQE